MAFVCFGWKCSYVLVCAELFVSCIKFSYVIIKMGGLVLNELSLFFVKIEVNECNVKNMIYIFNITKGDHFL